MDADGPAGDGTADSQMVDLWGVMDEFLGGAEPKSGVWGCVALANKSVEWRMHAEFWETGARQHDGEAGRGGDQQTGLSGSYGWEMRVLLKLMPRRRRRRMISSASMTG